MSRRDIPKLYKYRACSDTSFSILRNEKVWFAKPDTFNDPFDTCIRPQETQPAEYRKFLLWWGVSVHGLAGEKLANYVAQAFDENGHIRKERRLEMEKAEANAHQTLSEVGVLSLSEKNDNILMWSHYAQNHTGFCIEFSNLADNDLGNKAIKMCYSPGFPIFSSVDVITRTVSSKELFLTKSDDWVYEKEWRIISMEGNVEKPLPGQITSIVFGVKMEENNKNLVKDIFKGRPEVSFKQAVKVDGKFCLDIIEA